MIVNRKCHIFLSMNAVFCHLFNISVQLYLHICLNNTSLKSYVIHPGNLS